MFSDTAVSDINIIDGLDTFDNRLKAERKNRAQAGANSLVFGVKYLDDLFGGIYKSDLIVMGAKSGLGKTQMGTLIAMANTKLGKKVHYIALEAEEYEIERRIKYQYICELFFSDSQRPKVNLNYVNWYYGRYGDQLDKYETEAEEKLSLAGLNVYYRKGNFTEDDFEKIYAGVKNMTDLIIVDHLHYFDYTDDNENRAVKKIVKRMKDLSLLHGVPVLLISHLRKQDKKNRSAIPDLDEFHGSSDIGKIATKAIVISPANTPEDLKATRFTFVNAAKFRLDGSRQYYTGLMQFNINKQRYETGYKIVRSKESGDFDELLAKDVPDWAINALNSSKQKDVGF